MLLYHGTCFENVPGILSQGLLPSGSENGNWFDEYKSRPDAVYLSDAYAPYYAYMCGLLKMKICMGALIEIDIDLVEKHNFYPDEDFLAHSNLDLEVGEEITERTRNFRDDLKNYQQFWQNSLQQMGNCCYIGAIPLSAISRVTTWRWNDVEILKQWSYNYVYYNNGVSIFKDQDQGQLYRLLTKCFAKREVDLEQLLLLQKKCAPEANLDDEYEATLITQMNKINIEYDKDTSSNN